MRDLAEERVMMLLCAMVRQRREECAICGIGQRSE